MGLWYVSETNALRKKCSDTEFFLVRIYPHSDVFSPIAGKYGPEKNPYLDPFHALVNIKSLNLDSHI